MDVQIFGTKNCAFCKVEKQWLDSKNISYQYHDIDEDNGAKEYLNVVVGSSSVPVTSVGKGVETTYIKGFDRAKLSEALGI